MKNVINYTVLKTKFTSNRQKSSRFEEKSEVESSEKKINSSQILYVYICVFCIENFGQQLVDCFINFLPCIFFSGKSLVTLMRYDDSHNRRNNVG